MKRGIVTIFSTFLFIVSSLFASLLFPFIGILTVLSTVPVYLLYEGFVYYSKFRQSHATQPLKQDDSKKVLIVDDDSDLADLVGSIFEARGFKVETAYDFSKAFRKISDKKYDYIVLDWMLDGPHIGADLLESHPTSFSESKKLTNIITFSTRSFIDIYFPNQDEFAHFSHWHKPLMPSEIASRIANLTQKIGNGWHEPHPVSS